jgi:DNA-directed RNA polymerase specialized sigma24 family protein
MTPRAILPLQMAELKHLRALESDTAVSSDPRSDEQIVEGLVAGQEWAAEALYDRLQPVVDRALRRVLQSNADDHDDLAQIVFERIVRTLTQRKFAGACSLSTWATAIAAHVGIDALRARVRERVVVWEDRVRGDEQASRV